MNLGFSTTVVASYTDNIHLRKRANKIRGLLHNPIRSLPTDEQENILREFEKDLGDTVWQSPDSFRHGHQTSLLSARFRQKFWDAKAVAYRPCLKKALDWSSEEGPVIPQLIMTNAKKCIDAMLKSTRAFHTTQNKRCIITNAVGTAHVYGACFVSPGFYSRLTKLIVNSAT